jgi:TusA-related sulfurtransferase
MSNTGPESEPDARAIFLDITREVCPLTYVRVRLLLEGMRPGDVAEIRLAGAEPLANVPNALFLQGHSLLSLEAEDEGDGPHGPHRLRVQKS